MGLYERSILVLKRINDYFSGNEGLVLYDPTGISIWEFNANGKKGSDKLNVESFYLPVKHGNPFKNKEITNNIPQKYAKKGYSYLTMPEGIKFFGITLLHGGCNNRICYISERCISERGLKDFVVKCN